MVPDRRLLAVGENELVKPGVVGRHLIADELLELIDFERFAAARQRPPATLGARDNLKCGRDSGVRCLLRPADAVELEVALLPAQESQMRVIDDELDAVAFQVSGEREGESGATSALFIPSSAIALRIAWRSAIARDP